MRKTLAVPELTPVVPSYATALSVLHALAWPQAVKCEEGVTEQWCVQRVREVLSNSEITAYRERIARSMGNPGKYWQVAHYDGKFAGSIQGFSSEDTGYQVVQDLTVRPDLQRKGVGTALLRGFLGWADPSEAVEARVAEHNSPAKDFFRFFGFRELPDSQTLYMGKIPCIMMQLEPQEEAIK